MEHLVGDQDGTGDLSDGAHIVAEASGAVGRFGNLNGIDKRALSRGSDQDSLGG